MRFLLVLAGLVIAKDFCYETENKAKLFDVISFAMKRTKKRDLVLEVMFDNEETRNFIDQVFISCEDGGDILQHISISSKNLLKELFEGETYLYESAEKSLGIEKLLMLNIRAIVTGYRDFLHRIREEILSLDDLKIHRILNQLLLDNDIRKIILNPENLKASLSGEGSELSEKSREKLSDFLHLAEVQHVLKDNFILEEVLDIFEEPRPRFG